jgi:hypothetical protein
MNEMLGEMFPDKVDDDDAIASKENTDPVIKPPPPPAPTSRTARESVSCMSNMKDSVVSEYSDITYPDG